MPERKEFAEKHCQRALADTTFQVNYANCDRWHDQSHILGAADWVPIAEQLSERTVGSTCRSYKETPTVKSFKCDIWPLSSDEFKNRPIVA